MLNGHSIMVIRSKIGLLVCKIITDIMFGYQRFFSGHCETSRRSFTALAQEDNHTTESGSPAGGLGTISWLPLPLLMIFTAAFNLGLGSLTWVVATEILPVKSRGWTHTIANITSNFCWFLVTKTFNDLQDSFGLSAPFFLYGTVCVFGLIFIYIFLPETRGKTYEETAMEFEGCRPFKERLCCSIDGRTGKNVRM